MDCGKDTQTYILKMTWFTPLALAIIEKIFFSLRLPGSLLLTVCYILEEKFINPSLTSTYICHFSVKTFLGSIITL